MTQPISMGTAVPAIPAKPASEPVQARDAVNKASAPAQVQKPEAAVKQPMPVIVPKKTSVDLEEGINKIEEIVERMNQEMQTQRRGLSFAYDKTINSHVVTVKSASSGEVIRQIPSEVVVRVAHNIEKLKGLLFEGTY